MTVLRESSPVSPPLSLASHFIPHTSLILSLLIAFLEPLGSGGWEGVTALAQKGGVAVRNSTNGKRGAGLELSGAQLVL